MLIDYQAEWGTLYPSSNTRQMVQARLKNFLRFCYDNKWLDRVPRLSSIKADEAPTLPLSETEYAKLVKTAAVSFPDSAKAARPGSSVAHALERTCHPGRCDIAKG